MVDLPDLNNPAALVGGGVVGVLTLAMWVRRWATSWKAEGLEAAKIDTQADIVASLREQLKELTQEAKDLRAERKQLQDSIDAITANWREERKKMQDAIDEMTDEWRIERAQWREERQRLAETIDNLKAEVEELRGHNGLQTK